MRSWIAPRERVARAVCALVVLVGLGLASATTVLAHAYLESATPAPGTSLTQAPPELRLTFTEPPDPSFSSVQVLNARREQVDQGSHVAADDPRAMVVTLGSVPDGLYTVVWRTLSSVDGHTANGAYPLFIGVPATAGAAGAAQTTSDVTFAPETAVARWWLYLAASVVFGALVTWRAVLAPLLKGPLANERPLLARRLRLLALVGAGMLVLGTLYAAIAQAAGAADVPLWDTFGQPLGSVLAKGRYATIWWPRMGLALTILVVIAWRGLDGTAGDIALAATPAILLTSSLTSHSAALLSGAYLGIVVDWLHFLGAAVWIGGLASLLMVLPSLWGYGARLLGRVVGRFSTLALVSVVVIGVSGTFSAWLEIGSWAGLFTTTYGQSVLVKVGLMAVMVALGAFNMLVVGPRLAAAGGDSYGESSGRVSRRLVGLVPDGVGQLAGSSFAALAGALRRSVRIELGLGLVVLAVAALLTGLAPAREEIARRSSTDTLGGPVDRRLDVDGVPVQVSISPAVVGENVFSIGLPSTDPSTVERAQLTLTYLDAEQGSQPLILEPAADKPGTWSSTAPLLSQPGQWQAEVLVRRTGQDDLRSSLRFLVAGPGGVAAPSSSASAGYPLLPSPLTTLSYVIMAGGLVVVATGFLRNGSRRHRTTQAAVIAAGFLVIACGGYVYAREQTEGVPLDVVNVRDPVPPDQRSLASGKQIYTQYCETCHGETGRGDGPTGLRLVPRPADLQIHMAPGVHSDGELFYWISYGYPNSAMPAWHNTLSEQERWDVINYARTLVPDR